ncbi:MAG: DUF1318 domain-containing protein [Verrucomicrobiota bacterium]
MKIPTLRLILLFCALGAALPLVRAEDLGAIKARITQRLPSLDRLKASGAVGENLRGFVELRGGGSDAANVAAAENRDREAVYAAIGKQTGSTAETVGHARARQIAAGSASGVWLQREDGAWYQK